MNRLLLTALMLNVLSAGKASAELTVLTPVLVQKALSFALDAKQKNPTSPSDAAYRFTADFNGEFGDVVPVSLRVIDTPALTITISTPLSMVQYTLRTALARLSPLPTLDRLIALNDSIVVAVGPKQRGAPNITRIVLFRGDRELAQGKSTLAPHVFTNGFGAQFSLMEGTIEFPRDALTPGEEALRVVCLSETTPIEWKLSAADILRVR